MENKPYKWGVGILKILLCFCVILLHYGQGSLLTNRFSGIMSSAVPCFMIITFYFNSKILIEGNVKKLKNRIMRLLIPCIGWGGYILLYII